MISDPKTKQDNNFNDDFKNSLGSESNIRIQFQSIMNEQDKPDFSATKMRSRIGNTGNLSEKDMKDKYNKEVERATKEYENWLDNYIKYAHDRYGIDIQPNLAGSDKNNNVYTYIYRASSEKGPNTLGAVMSSYVNDMRQEYRKYIQNVEEARDMNSNARNK